MSAAARYALGNFATGRTAHVSQAQPAAVLELPARQIFDALYARLGGVLAKALDPSRSVDSPRAHRPDGSWLQHSHSVGINLRTTGGLLGGLRYVLTLPPHIDAIHLLPVFEPGVVGSLYGMSSWHVNQEFFSREWADLLPAQRHVNDQLRAFVNLCHALGKTVGLDVIPHTDRFSEIALCNPWLFEWVRRRDTELLDHRPHLHEEVMAVIYGFRSGRSNPQLVRSFFAQRESVIAYELFGDGDVQARNGRRDELVQWLYDFGYETLPATMAPPYRGLELDPAEAAVTVDHRGRRWRDFRFVDPGPMSRVFGPLTRYHLWEALPGDDAWALDHDHPRMPVWHYVAQHYAHFVEHYGFDFMRGDMSHVQTRAAGVPPEPAPEPYDLLRFVKEACAKTRPHFAYFAESFLTADNFMTYGSEAEHLARSRADVALGNLQNYAPADPAFHEVLAEYEQLRAAGTAGDTVRAAHHFAPAFTIFTADKDDPRFDANFLTGNVARYAFATFCPRYPVYSSLGFRTRDAHAEPAPNEHYSKLYVFHYDEGPKATHGPYVFGDNHQLWEQVQRIDAFRQRLRDVDVDADFAWLLPPDATGQRQVVAWSWGIYGFAVNFGNAPAAVDVGSLVDPVFVAPRGCWRADSMKLGGDGVVVFYV